MPGGGHSAAGLLVGRGHRILYADAPATAITEMVLHDLGQVPQEDQNPFKTLLPKLLDLVLDKRASKNRHHWFRSVIRERSHPGATSPGEDDRLPRSIIGAAFDARLGEAAVEGCHHARPGRSVTRRLVIAWQITECTSSTSS